MFACRNVQWKNFNVFRKSLAENRLHVVRWKQLECALLLHLFVKFKTNVCLQKCPVEKF